MRAHASIIVALGLASCAPSTILSAHTVKNDGSKVFGQIASALDGAGYKCNQDDDEHSFSARCQGKSGGISVEVKRKTERPVLALRFWFKNSECGTAALASRLEKFNLEDRSGGTRAYCIEDRLMLAFETFLPSQGIEPNELATLVTKWEKSAGIAAERFGLMPEEGGDDPPGEKS